MRKSQLERLRDAKRKGQRTIKADLEGLLELLTGGKLNPTQKAFIYDSTRIKAYMGPAGCAKTTTLCAAGLIRALLQPGSKGLVARFDYNKLLDTTAGSMLQMVERLPKGVLIDRDKSPPMKWWIRPIGIPDERDEMDETPSQITFVGMKDSFGSYELNWAVLDEADEMDERRVLEVDTRFRNKGGNYSLMMAFNPPDKHHWLYGACTGRDHQDRLIKGKDPWVKLFKPQPRENVLNLPPGYYETMARSLTDDMRQRLVDGDWGSTFNGQPVFREFRYNTHVRDNILFDPQLDLLRFWDFGYRRPVCLWAQLDYEGRLLLLAESLGDGIEIKPWADRVKMLTARNFRGAQKILDFGDPAARQHKDTGSTLTHLNRAGIQMMYRTDVKFEAGIRAIRMLLERLVEGEPAIQFSRQGCPALINAMRGGYKLKDDGVTPHKDNFFDNCADSLRYGIINLFDGLGELPDSANMPESLEYDRLADTPVHEQYADQILSLAPSGLGWEN